MTRFVALGDSLTEGVGDPHPACPNGLRGWADLLAARLGAHDPASEYANLALRGKTAADVLAEQVAAAVALQPTLVSLWAGGNDILRPRLRPGVVLERLEESVSRLTSTGAEVLVFTGFELTGSPVLALLRHRARTLNAGLRTITRAHGAALIDVASPTGWADRRLWLTDRVHPSSHGHARIAAHVAQVLGMPPYPALAPAEPDREGEPIGIRERLRLEREWWREDVWPHAGRCVTGASSREAATAKWTQVVRPARDFAW